MVRDNVSKVEGLLRLLQQAENMYYTTSNERLRFIEQFNDCIGVVVHSYECESYPTVNDYATFFAEFDAVCKLHPTWHSMTHRVDELGGLDSDVRCTIYGYARIEHIHDSPSWIEICQREEQYRGSSVVIRGQIVDLVRGLQSDTSIEKSKLVAETTESDAEFWTRHTISRKD